MSDLATKNDVRALGEQILQLRAEIHVDLQAIRQEIKTGEERLAATLREEIRAGDERLAATLREEMRAGDEETRRFMRVLHEEVIDRLKRLSG